MGEGIVLAEAAAAASSSRARDLPNQDHVHILDDTGHMVQMERASEVNRLITAFWSAQD